MKKLSFILVLLSVLFFSCSSPTIESTSELSPNNLPAESAHTHTLQIQKLFYDESFTLIGNHTLCVEVSADGCTCTECGAKYHTNEYNSYYIDGSYHGSHLNQTLISLYRTMGCNKGQASIFAQDTYNKVYCSLYNYYRSQGYENNLYLN